MVKNPFLQSQKKALQKVLGADTLVGGTVGSQERSKSVLNSASSARPSSTQVESFSTALDALSAMFCGLIGDDRELLDAGFEALVGEVEEWRDAVPKA